MTRFDKELNFVLYVLNPFNLAEVNDKQFSQLNELKLIDILKSNKALQSFSKRINTQTKQLRENFFSRYPKISLLLQELKVRQANDFSEFLRISKKLSEQDVHLLLIKSSGEFPFESSNIDCLVKPEELAITARILTNEGYHELLIAREPNKFLFRKPLKPKELPLHIHTRVEWEAIEFAEAHKVIKRSRPFINQESGALVPSVEDAILITVAHYFFEDHEIKLYDLLKLKLMNERKLDFDYLHAQASKLSWNDAFLLNISLVNRMSYEFFGKKVFGQSFQKNIANSPSFTSKFISYRPNGVLRIPYAVSAFFFLKKIGNSKFSTSKKFGQVGYVWKDILRRSIVGYIEV